MELKQYDGKRIQITATDGLKYEGIGDYCSADYCEHEYGRAEEGIKLVNYLFYRGYIWSVRDLEVQPGPYDGFTAPFGRIEEENLREGLGFVEDQLTCEEDVHVLRMLRCLADRLQRRQIIPDRDKIPAVLRESLSFIKDPAVRQEAQALLENWT
ncbi:MAG: hypothetical protein J5633_01300 [Oscillospiraceae bacterium]|nr:hypothetical protein [Oscillospiraceae bacterium]